MKVDTLTETRGTIYKSITPLQATDVILALFIISIVASKRGI